MKCMCPNCGKIIYDGERTFDFTDFVRGRLEKIMQDFEDITQNEENGRDSLLNEWKNTNHPLVFSEAQILSFPLAEEQDDNPCNKTVKFSVPVNEIKKKFKEVDTNHEKIESMKAFIDWVENHEIELELQEEKLTLTLDGEGNLEFSRIIEIPGADVRKCPHCYSKLSYWAGRYKEWTLTVLGGPRVSKSTAVTACVAAFMRDRDRFVQFEGSDDDEGYKVFKELYLDRYEEGRYIRATDTNDNIPRVSFRVSIGKRDICLTFVDLPGELNSESGISEDLNRRYQDIFGNIDFVWYCTDPGEIQQLEGDIVATGLGYGDRGVVSTQRIKSNMRKLSAYFKHMNKKIPVAYIVGKTDSIAVKEEDQKKYGLYDERCSEITLPFNVRSFFFRSDKVRKYISSKNNENLISEFERLFGERCYIATSAYGYNPIEVRDNERREPQGYNCKEAFYWMLALRNCVDVCVETRKRGLFGKEKIVEITGKLSDLDDNVREKAYHNLYMSGGYLI